MNTPQPVTELPMKLSLATMAEYSEARRRITAEAIGSLPHRITQPGFYDLTAAEYHADPICEPSLSSSVAAQVVLESPAHARLSHPRLNPDYEPRKASDAMEFGNAVHSLALGKGCEVARWDGSTWVPAEAKAFRAQAIAAGKIPLKINDHTRAQDCANALHRQLDEMGLGYVLTDGEPEKVIAWKEGEFWMRAMLDRWIPDRNLIVDIKTTGKSAHPQQAGRTARAMGYDIRSEFYLRGASKLTGIPARKGGLGFMFLFIETSAPYCLTPCFLDEESQARGRRMCGQAIDTWARCMEAKTWPGYATSAVEICTTGYGDMEAESEISAS